MLAYEKSGVLCAVLLPVYFGSQNPGQWDLPLCIHTNSETQKAILCDIVDSLHGQGLKKLVIVNGHGGNTFKTYIRDLAKKYPDFTVIAVDWWSIVPVGNYFEEKIDEHGGEQETSVLLHYRPDLVKMEQAGSGKITPLPMESINQRIGWLPRPWQQLSEDTGIGNPEKSTAEKGKRYAEAVVEKIARSIHVTPPATSIVRKEKENGTNRIPCIRNRDLRTDTTKMSPERCSVEGSSPIRFFLDPACVNVLSMVITG